MVILTELDVGYEYLCFGVYSMCGVDRWKRVDFTEIMKEYWGALIQ